MIWVFTQKISSNNIVDIEGIVAVYGSDPHTYIGVKSGKEIFKITNPKEFGLWKLQNKFIKLRGVIIKDEVGPAFPKTIKVLDIMEIRKP